MQSKMPQYQVIVIRYYQMQYLVLFKESVRFASFLSPYPHPPPRPSQWLFEFGFRLNCRTTAAGGVGHVRLVLHLRNMHCSLNVKKWTVIKICAYVCVLNLWYKYIVLVSILRGLFLFSCDHEGIRIGTIS